MLHAIYRKFVILRYLKNEMIRGSKKEALWSEWISINQLNIVDEISTLCVWSADGDVKLFQIYQLKLDNQKTGFCEFQKKFYRKLKWRKVPR